MKRVLFILFVLFGLLSCEEQQYKVPAGFVQMENEKFVLNGRNYFPLGINYYADLQQSENEIWVTQSRSYTPNHEYPFSDKENGFKVITADMQMIKDMGFNCIRLVGIENHLSLKNLVEGKSALNYEQYFTALEELFDMLDSYELKVIFLLEVVHEDEFIYPHLKKLFSRFKNRTTILAYDFFNEPLYFDKKERSKKEVYKITNYWESLVNQYAPNHLFTIGLTGPRETFEWDPNMLTMDFITFHPYEFKPRMTENELYWYYKNIKKPWMIGENGFSADNDSISYSEQHDFIQRILPLAINCGAIGYTWWQYKDVNWYDFQSNYLGVINWDGHHTTSDTILTIQGSPKPLIETFKTFNPEIPKQLPKKLSNYYNYGQYKDYVVRGKLINQNTNQPIEEGLIVGWNNSYSKSYITFTKADGTFELFGDFKFYHFIFSASLMSTHREDFDWDQKADTTSYPPSVNIGPILLEELNFLK